MGRLFFRMLALRLTALTLGLLVFSSCAYTPGGKGFPWGMNLSAMKCKEDLSRFLVGVDWNQARVLDVRIRQGRFSPTYLGLYMGQSYILRIENADDANHTFRASDFFRAVAVAGVSADGGNFQELKCLAGVTIPPQTKTALRFVPVRDGTYEFDDKSIVNSLAMIGSGGGFITIEPRRRIIESPRKHLNLFDHKPVEIKTERTKLTGPDGDADPILAPDASPSELSDDLKNTNLNQPSNEFESPISQQSTDSRPLQPVAISPLSETPVADQAPEAPVVPRDETEGGNFVEKVLVVEEAPVTPAIVNGSTQPDASETMPESFQLFQGPPADVYSDPPDGFKAQSGSGGDAGEDKLDSLS